MFIKLQPEQITCFWEYIKKGMIESYEVPVKFQQDFAIKSLSNLLIGMTQCWVGTYVDDKGDRRLHYIVTTKIVDGDYGDKLLLVDSFYSVMPVNKEIFLESYKSISEFAKANDCNYLIAVRKNKGIEKMLLDLGFDPHKIIYRKSLV